MLYQDQMAYGWVNEHVFQRIADLDYDWIDDCGMLDEIDFFDYSALWIETGLQSDMFHEWWENNLDRIEEYVSAGYAIYLEQGSRAGDFRVFTAPGGLEFVVRAGEEGQWGGSMEQSGVLVVGPEDNWLVERMGWEEGQFFLGDRLGPFSQGVYPVVSLEAIENSDEYQVIMNGIRTGDPITVQYNYGFGKVLITGAIAGRQWSMQIEEGEWGSCGEELIEYLTIICGGPPWVYCVPTEGSINVGGDQDVIVNIDTDGLFTGFYEAALHFLSNDPVNPDVSAQISVNVTGFPIPDVYWSVELGFPDSLDFNSAYEELYTGGAYPVEVTIENAGTDDLHIAEITFENNDFSSDWDPDEDGVVPAGEQIDVNFIHESDENGRSAGTFAISFDDEDVDPFEGLVMATSIPAPALVVNPNEINDELMTGETSEHIIDLRNEGEALLIWYSDAEIIAEPEEERDNGSIRSVRSTNEKIGPLRDEPGDIFDEFRHPRAIDNVYRGGFAWDRDNDWMWISQYGHLGNPGIIIAVDPWNNYELMVEFNGPIGSADMCWMNGTLYVIDAIMRPIARFDIDGNRLEDIETPDWRACGIAASQELELFFVMEDWPDNFDRPIHVFEAAEDGEFGDQIGEISNYRAIMRGENQANNVAKCLLWADEHANGNLWVASGAANDGNLAWQFAVNQDNWEAEFVQNFHTFEGNHGTDLDGIGHDGENIWASTWSTTMIRIIDDGINERGWLSWWLRSGEIEPDDSYEITVRLSAQGLIGGEYLAELYIFSNDPAELFGPDVTVDITINVIAHPNIHVIPGGDDEEPIEFDIAYFGYPISKTITVQNSGVGNLTLDEVIRDEDNPDFYIPDEDIEDFILRPDEELELDVWYDPDPERGGRQAATLMFMSNDPNWDEGYPVSCIASRGAFEAPVLLIDPNEINANLDEGESRNFPINLLNNGGSTLWWETAFEIIDQPGDERDHYVNRNVRRTGEQADETDSVNPTSYSTNLRRSLPGQPHRDQPQGRGLLIQERCGWYDYNFEDHFQAIEGLEYDRYRTWNELNDVDLTEYDFMWIGNFESNEWTNAHNRFLERIEEFVDGGGAIYHSSSSIQHEVRPINPGGLVYVGGVNDGQRNCPLVLNPEDNFFINYMNENDPVGWDWRAGQQLTGWRDMAWVAVGYFRTEDLEAIENSDWYEPMALGNPVEEPVIVTYRYGSGYCFVNTLQDGMHHHWGGAAQWARTGEAVIWYLDFLSSEVDTFTVEPDSGELEPGEDQDVILTINTTQLVNGQYEVALHFISNDPENPDQIVELSFAVAGEPEISGDPIPHPLEGAEDIVLDGTFYAGQRYESTVVVENIGGAIVEINEVRVTDQDNWDFIFPDDEMIINPQSSVEASLIFHPIDVGDLETEIRLLTNAVNVENGEVWWTTSGSAILPPLIGVELPGDRPSIEVALMLDDDPVERIAIISNAEGDGRDNIEFLISIDDREDEVGRDGRRRQVRSTDNNENPYHRTVMFSGAGMDACPTGPQRDDAGDILGEIRVPGVYTYSMASNDEYVWGCSYTQSRLTAVSIEEMEVVYDRAIHQRPWGMTFDGQNLWIAQWPNSSIFIYDTEGEQIDEFDLDIEWITGMGSDRSEYVYVKSGNNDRIYVYSIEDHERVAIINQLPGFDNQLVREIDWVPDHGEGQLWGLGRNVLYQAHVDDEWQVEPVQTFDHGQDWHACGLTHDGENLWIGTCEDRWIVMDDGIIEGIPAWLTIDPMNGVIPAGESEDITLTFSTEGLDDNTRYETEMLIESNDPENPIINIAVSLVVGISELVHFTADDPETDEIDGWIESDAVHTLEVTTLTFDEEPVPTGWEIGVFTPDDLLAGGIVWRDGAAAELIAYGDNPDIEEVTGFRNGERFQFLVWDNVEDVEYQPDVDFEEGPEIWTADRRSSIILAVFDIPWNALHLQGGWNMISINVNPRQYYDNEDDPGPNIVRMFEELRIDEDNHRIEILKDGVGRFWAPAFGFINIPYWNLTEGYQVKLTEAVVIEIIGLPIPPDRDIPLNPGWNLIAYFPTYDLEASAPDFHVLSLIIDHVILAKDYCGRFLMPALRFSNMVPWTEGQGYQVKIESEEVVVLNYPPEQDNAALSYIEEEIGKHWRVPVNSGVNMSVLINDITGLNPAPGDKIAVFNTSNELVGVGNIDDKRCGLTVWGDDPSTTVIDGAKGREALRLSYWDSDLGLEYNLNTTAIHCGNGLIYETDGFTALDAAVQAAIPDNFYLSQNYPNPFNNVTKLTFGLTEAGIVKLNVYDLSGRLVKTLIDGEMQAGHHSVMLNAENLSAGIYMIKLKSAGFNSARKTVLVK